MPGPFGGADAGTRGRLLFLGPAQPPLAPTGGDALRTQPLMPTSLPNHWPARAAKNALSPITSPSSSSYGGDSPALHPWLALCLNQGLAPPPPYTHTRTTQKSPPYERKEVPLPCSSVKHDHGREERVPIHVSAKIHRCYLIFYFILKVKGSCQVKACESLVNMM